MNASVIGGSARVEAERLADCPTETAAWIGANPAGVWDGVKKASPVAVMIGSGQYIYYVGNLSGGYLLPLSGSATPGAVNALYGQPRYSGFTETAPDGTIYTCGPVASVPNVPLTSIQNPAGATWTVAYDSSGRVSSITDPFARLTSFAYNGTSGKISSIKDFAGRLTSFTVNSAGNLTSVISPELCVTSLVYDGSNRAVAWINPLGETIIYAYEYLIEHVNQDQGVHVFRDTIVAAPLKEASDGRLPAIAIRSISATLSPRPHLRQEALGIDPRSRNMSGQEPTGTGFRSDTSDPIGKAETQGAE